MSKNQNITILVAPLDWGLGHATRCIPLITELLKLGCKVIIAADGVQDNLLKTEFPNLDFVNLPGYKIKYSGTKRFFAIKILSQLPKIFAAISREKRWLQTFINRTSVDAIISDNRYGLQCRGVPSVFITHQLLIKGPFALAEKVMQRISYLMIEKFTACWVPDEQGSRNFAGVLSHPCKYPTIPIQFLGGLSRLNKQVDSIRYKILVIISGPEPQRTALEKRLLAQLLTFDKPVLFVRGVPVGKDLAPVRDNITIRNHLPAKDLEKAFAESEFIISRSGYTTVMDICKLQKKAILIPTPGQTEQEYLANHLHQQGWCMKMNQEDFSLTDMFEILKRFEYKFPQWEMENYKKVLKHFVSGLKKINR